MNARSKMPSRKTLLSAAVVLALGSAAALHAQRVPPQNLIDRVTSAVPKAAPFFKSRGGGFAAQKSGIQSATGSLPGQENARTIAVSAPNQANGEFSVNAASVKLATVRLVGASARSAELENKAVVYRSAYPDVDVVAVRDPERFEINYVFGRVQNAPEVAFELGSFDDGSIAEAADGSLTVSSATGRPRLRVSQPVAVDAKGTTRRGHYRVESRTVHVSLDIADLVPPVVLDPVFYIPFWTITADGRQPGSTNYLQARGSRETQVSLNPKTGKPWLIRPTRSQQPEDRRTHFGELYNWSDNFPAVSSLPRIPGSTGANASADLLADWQRTYFAESETWEWSGSRWRLLPQTGLDGLIDAGFAYAPGSQKMVAFGGATPEFFCNDQGTGLTLCGSDLYSLKNGTRVYENDGSGWTQRGLSGAPRPRLRPGMSTFGAGVLVFGGRAMLLDALAKAVDGSSNTQNAPPFPDSLATDLLNDTWLFDGKSWKSIAVSNPPPAQEQAKLVYDTRRKRAVLVGGNSVPAPELANPPILGLDTFSLWEFDGVDWVQRFEPGDSRLPASFQKRRGVATVWHPVRQTTILFGGFVDVLESCPYSGTLLQQKRDAATAGTFAEQQAAKLALTTQGCMPGYAHDTWEWDGRSLKQLTQVAFDQFQSLRIVSVGQPLTTQQAIYRQVSGAVPPPGTLAVDDLAGAAQSHLWPFRYDASGNHFPLRSALERAYAPPSAAPPIRKDAGNTLTSATNASTSFVSPTFTANSTPQLSFEPGSGRLLIFGNGGRVFDTDLSNWLERTPSQSPFDRGQNELFAATWDSARQRIALFDPVTGATWEGTEAGAWTKIETAGPGVWSVDSTIRTVAELDAPGLLQLPKMSYDRARARTTLLYRDALWEYDAANAIWSQAALPASLTGCKAATMMVYDGARQRTVLVGCSVPGKTWEWDGSAWVGPLAGPFTAPIRRWDDFAVGSNPNPEFRWQGTLQLAWAHPNALFETPSLGGVATTDADGQLTIWNGTTWSRNQTIAEGHLSDAASRIFTSTNRSNYGLPFSLGFINDYDYAPNTFSMPIIEDYEANRLLAFRDGVTGLRELRFSEAAEQRHWEKTNVGYADPVPFSGDLIDIVGPDGPVQPKRVNPHPFELLSPEHITLRALTDPATRTDWAGQTKSFYPADEWVNNLYWPFRLLPDPVTHRVHILTHRGAIWEMGSETVQSLGGPCQSKNDCEGDSECEQGVCCDSTCSGSCQTCNGAHPGTCERLAVGTVCQAAKCANGILSSTSQCSEAGQCGYAGTGKACAGGFACADGTSCRTHCSTSADCADSTQICNADGTACVQAPPPGPVSCQDGMLTHADGSTAQCPGHLGCADANSCRTQCISHSDCADSIGMLCASGVTCVMDGAATLAAARGVTPVKWAAPAAKSPQQIADELVQLGYQKDETGTILAPGAYSNGVQFGFDPNLKTPLTGVRSCLYRVQACMVSTMKVDECVAATPRCEGATPWLGDPAGLDCCPEACLEKYFTRRATSNERVALDEFLFSGCYPELSAYLAQDSP